MPPLGRSFLPGVRSAAPGGALGAFVARGGRVVAGSGAGRASSGVVAFLWGPSRGSVFTVREAIRAGKPAAVVLAGGGAELPRFSGGGWAPCTIGPDPAFRWVGEPPEPDNGGEPKRTALHRIFVVPDAEPVHAPMEHIAPLSPGERLWFGPTERLPINRNRQERLWYPVC